jgi:hypothetical protein
MVLFVGDDGKPVRARINNDGSYEANDVPVGNVKIAVRVRARPPVDPNDPQSPHPPQKYMNTDTSDLTYTVTSGSQTCPLDLK